MRFSFASAFAFSTLFLGALSAPTGDVLNGVSGVSGLTQSAGSLTKTYSSTTEKTTTVTKNETVYSVVQTLYSNVQQHTSSINKTVAAVPAQASEDDKKTALIDIKADIKSITSLIVDASVKVGKIEVNADVDVSAIVSLVVKLVLEIVATLQGVVAVLGGSKFSSSSTFSLSDADKSPAIAGLLGSVLTLLVHAISALLLALQDILGDVIATVWSIVSGLLPFVGDILVGLGEVLKGDCNCLTL